MITIIHGDDISASRKYFQDLKSKEKNVVSFGDGKITITDLVQNIEGSSLFGDTKSIFIEEFLTKLKKTNEESKEILEFLIKNYKSANFALWESKEISKRDLFIFKDAIIKNFKLPQSIFLFLDNLKPNSHLPGGNLPLKLFHQMLDSEIKEELILFMMQRQFRLLLSLCHPERSEGFQIDEISRLAPWQRSKLDKQAKSFSEEDLKKIYEKLYEIELAQKTGTLPLSLTQTIDFLLFEI